MGGDWRKRPRMVIVLLILGLLSNAPSFVRVWSKGNRRGVLHSSTIRDNARFLLPVIPSTAVLRMLRSLGNYSIGADDITITDAFLHGACVTAVLSQAREPASSQRHTGAVWRNYNLLRMTARFDRMSSGETVLPVLWQNFRALSTARWVDQSSAVVIGCHAALVDVSCVDIIFQYPAYAPSAVSVSRVIDSLTPHHAVICTTIAGTALDHLATWIEYHSAIGFSHVYVYVNEPWSDFVARPYSDRLMELSFLGLLTLTAWYYPRWFPGDDVAHFAQTTAMNACHRRYRTVATHFAFLDVDEFLHVGRQGLTGLLQNASDGCVLLPNTWGVVTSVIESPITLDKLLSSRIMTLGPLRDVDGDPHAQFRHKIYSHYAPLSIVGVHGMMDVTSRSSGAAQGRPPCEFQWNQTRATTNSVSATVGGFLHILSDSLVSTRPRPENHSRTRNAARIRNAILDGKRSFATNVLTQSVGRSVGAQPTEYASLTVVPPLRNLSNKGMHLVDAWLHGPCISFLLVTVTDLSNLALPALSTWSEQQSSYDSIVVTSLTSISMESGSTYAVFGEACHVRIARLQYARMRLSAGLSDGDGIDIVRHYSPAYKFSCLLCAQLSRIPEGIAMKRWIDYYFDLGVEHIVVYVRATQQVLSRSRAFKWMHYFAQTGRVTFIGWNFTSPFISGTSDYRLLAQNDCVRKYSNDAETIVSVDFDDYLVLHVNHSIGSIFLVSGSGNSCFRIEGESRDVNVVDYGNEERLEAVVDRERGLCSQRESMSEKLDDGIIVRPDSIKLVGTHSVHPSNTTCVRQDKSLLKFIRLTVKHDDPADLTEGMCSSASLPRQLLQPRGYCGLCVTDAPLTEEQVAVTGAAEDFLALHVEAQDSGYFERERIAYARCEGSRVCPVTNSAPLSTVGTETSSVSARLARLHSYPGMPDPLPMPEDVPIGTKLIVQGENTRGRYANMRYAVLDFVQIALLTNRTAVLAPMGHSLRQCSESLEDLFDWPHLNSLVRVVAPPTLTSRLPRQRLDKHCGPGYPSPMLVNLERHIYTPRSTTLAPTWGQWKVANGVDWSFHPYALRSQLVPLLQKYADTRCLGLSAGFWAFPFWHPDAERMRNALRPSLSIQRAIDSFLDEALEGGNASLYVTVHMRLTDLGTSNKTFCARNMTETVGVVDSLQQMHGLSGVALATDDFDSLCAREFIAAFPRTVAVRSGAFHVDSCAEAQFVQEVLARGACFVGSVNSTMSTSVEDIRDSTRARGTALPGCAVRLGAGQTRFEW